MSDEFLRNRGSVTRQDGTVEDVTYAVEVMDHGGFRVYDFRTTDGAPLILLPTESFTVNDA